MKEGENEGYAYARGIQHWKERIIRHVELERNDEE